MSASFDPYQAWLGIAPEDRPINHYSLLGLPRLENNPAKITAAVPKRLQQVKQHQQGAYAAQCAKLVTEIEAAAICLGNPALKAKYDASLGGSANVMVKQEPLLATYADDSDEDRSISPIALGAIVAGGLMLFIVIVAVAGYSLLGVTRTVAVAPPAAVAAPPITTTPVAPRKSPPSPQPPVTPAVEQKPIVRPKVKPIDLLAKADLSKDILRGTWTRNQGKLLSSRGQPDTLQLMKDPPENYNLELQFARRENNEGMFIGLVLQGQPCMLNIDGFSGEGYFSGFDMIDGHRVNSAPNPTSVRGQLVQNNQEYKLRCLVRGNRIYVTIDGKKLVDWQGDTKRLSTFGLFRTPHPQTLYIGSWDAKYEFSKIDFEATDEAIP